MRTPRSHGAAAFSSFDGLDVGLDRGVPVDFTYTPPFKFPGKLKR